MTDYEQTLRRGLEHSRKNPEQDLESLVEHLTALIFQLEKAGKIDEAKELSAECDEAAQKLAEQKAREEQS